MSTHRTVRSIVVGAALVLATAFAARAEIDFDDLVATAEQTIPADRFALEGANDRESASSARILRRSERTLRRLRRLVDKDPEMDTARLRLVGRVVRDIERAVDAGGLPADSASSTFAGQWSAACINDVTTTREDAFRDRDRLVDEHATQKVTRRLDKAEQRFQQALAEQSVSRRVAAVSVALREFDRGGALARRLADRESRARLPGGVAIADGVLTYRGRGVTTVYDLEWDVTITTAAGLVVERRTGALNRPGSHIVMPLTLQRGETLDAVAAMQLLRTTERYVDGTLTWRTSAGNVTVALHLRP